MALVAAVISGILLEYFILVMMVGMARGKTGIQAPAMTGDPLLERAVRVQMNTLEQMVVVIPAMLVFGFYLSALWSAILGGVFIAGRALYARMYMLDPGKRGAGFLIGFLATVVLIAGALYGSILTAIS